MNKTTVYDCPEIELLKTVNRVKNITPIYSYI